MYAHNSDFFIAPVLPAERQQHPRFGLALWWLTVAALFFLAVMASCTSVLEVKGSMPLTSGANWKGPIGEFRLVVDKGKPRTVTQPASKP